ncbi:TIGR02285 family protein [Alteromonas facilis]|uniref:TIGR02285 family protein n=1 Tax=Alteromonas facilis TaxID=2048004 RepID=UPI0013DC3D1E|nr:TIGR02285 family protein [Alteromonas facilis]
MKKSYLLSLLTFLPLGFAFNATADENEINWQVFHAPPIHIKVGPDAGKGFVDLMLTELMSKMPEYQHHQPFTTQSRALHDIEVGKQVCHPSLFKTPEREKFAVFSKPTLFSPANRLIVKPADIVALELPQVIDLDEILQQHQLTLGLVQGRSYGPYIDGIIKGYGDDNIVRISPEQSEVIFRLLENGRIQSTVAYPFEVNYYHRYNMQEAHQKVALYIKGEPEFVMGRVACPNNEWGQKVVHRVNAVLSELVRTDAYEKAMTTWWREEADTAAFRDFYDTVFLSHYAIE